MDNAFDIADISDNCKAMQSFMNGSGILIIELINIFTRLYEAHVLHIPLTYNSWSDVVIISSFPFQLIAF